MRLTNSKEVRQEVERIFSLPNQYLMGIDHFERMFLNLDGILGYRLAGETTDAIAEQFKKEVRDDFKPARLFVYYVGYSLRISEIQELDELFCSQEHWKRGLILSDLPFGRLTVYAFYRKA